MARSVCDAAVGKIEVEMTVVWSAFASTRTQSQHALRPVLGYLAATVSAAALLMRVPWAPNLMALALMALLVAGTRNAWDRAIWIVTRSNNRDSRDRGDSAPQSSSLRTLPYGLPAIGFGSIDPDDLTVDQGSPAPRGPAAAISTLEPGTQTVSSAARRAPRDVAGNLTPVLAAALSFGYGLEGFEPLPSLWCVLIDRP
jgi:hypothetical protein